MKKFFWMVAAATALFASCAKDATTDVLPAPEATDDFTATFDMSRAELDGTTVLWNAEDQITIFTKTAHNRKYQVKTLSEDQRTATFGYVTFTGNDATTISANYAVYPYDAEATISGDVITTKINAEQAYNADKVDLSNSLMVAKSDNLTLAFVNAGGLLRFKVAKENLPDVYTLKSINVTSKNNNLAGTVEINTATDSKAVVLDDSNASNSATLTDIDVEIKQEVQMFYLALPATNFETEDLTLTFTFEMNGAEWEKVIELPAFELKQNAIKTISYTIKAEDEFTGVTPDSDEVWDGTTVTEPEVANGTYTITSPAEFAWLGDFVSGKGLKDVTIEITKSLDMGGAEFGNLMISGESVINGNGNTISNAKFVEAPYADGSNSGHNGQAAGAGFVYVPTNSKVTLNNLNFDGCESQGVMHNHGSGGAGIVSTYVQGTLELNEVHVTNAKVNGVYSLGALVGEVASGTLIATNCSVDGAVINNEEVTDESGLMGGLIGRVTGTATLEQCSVADVTLNAYVATDKEHKRTIGGFVGNFAGGTLTIADCSAEDVTINAMNDLAKTEQNLFGDLLGGWRTTATSGKVTIDGADVVAATEAAVKTALQSGGKVALPAGSYNVDYSPKAGTEIVGLGIDKTILNVADKQYSIDGGDVSFENLTLKKGNSNYTGFAHSKNTTFINCKIEGVLFLYAENTTFADCEFVQTQDAYNVWTYGATNITFTDCKFKAAQGKALLIFQDGSNVDQTVTVTGCEFTADAVGTTWDGKQVTAMDIDSTNGTYVLNIDNTTTVSGFGVGAVSGSMYWNHKAGKNSVTVNMDGRQVYKN